MPLSKVFSVKSNAARSAKPYGITRDELIHVEGGWAFEMPTNGATEPVISAPEPEAAPPATAAPAGWDKVEPGPEQFGQTETLAALVAAALARFDDLARLTPLAVTRSMAPKPAKATKVAKAPKAARIKAAKAAKTNDESHGKFPGSPAYQGRRTAQGQRGIIEDVRKQLRAWTPADDILKMTGWVSNTFRGVLGKFRRDGLDVKMERREDGTYYRIADFQ